MVRAKYLLADIKLKCLPVINRNVEKIINHHHNTLSMIQFLIDSLTVYNIVSVSFYLLKTIIIAIFIKHVTIDLYIFVCMYVYILS